MEKSKKPHDILPLPSKGHFYESKVGRVKVEYLTGADEDYLSNIDKISSGAVWKDLWEIKCKDSDKLAYGDLLFCDKMAFMIWVRKTAYGSIYTQPVRNPNTNKMEDVEVDIEKLIFSEPAISLCDENGEFTFQTPRGNIIKYRPLTAREDDEAVKQAEAEKAKLNLRVAPNLRVKLERQIMEVDGNRDKMAIRSFIEGHDFRPSDSLALRKHMQEMMPNLDLTYTGRFPSGKEVTFVVDIRLSFFFPALTV